MGKKNFKRKLNPNEQQTKLYDKITYLETKIISKINSLKKIKSSFNLCDHLQKVNDEAEFDETINYYDRFWKEYMMTVVFVKKMQEFQSHVSSMEHNVTQIQKKITERQAILNLPALAKVKKPISKHLKIKAQSQKQEQKQQLNQIAPNSIIHLKKQEEVEPHLHNYQSSQNQIYYE